MLGAAPFSHVLGLSTGIVSTLSSGGAIAVERRFDAQPTLELMTEVGVTVLLGVPTMCIALSEVARRAERLPPVRIAHVGGAAVPAEVGATFERLFGADVYEGYGMTEMSGIATTYSAGQVRKLGSVGISARRDRDPHRRGRRARRRRGALSRAVCDPRLLERPAGDGRGDLVRRLARDG